MKLKLSLGVFLCTQVFFSCAQNPNSPQQNFKLVDNFLNKVLPKDENPNLLNGIWVNAWKNRDGYSIYEYVIVNPDDKKSYSCVLNAMGGYEFSSATIKGEKVFTTFIDPKKEIYINKLSKFGHKGEDVELSYQSTNDTLVWKNNSNHKYRTNEFKRLRSSDTKSWERFQSTCAQLTEQTSKVNLTDIRTEKLMLQLEPSIIAGLQISKKHPEKSHYCVYNLKNKTVSSLPVQAQSNGSIIFSELDRLDASDKGKLFDTDSLDPMTKYVSSEMLAKCSALSELTLKQNNNFREGQEASTYLVCNYSNNTTGAKSGWEWGEYPLWEWEEQRQSCKGLFASNCISLNGHWARDDIGVKAIGTMFIMDSSSKIEADFNRACYETNQLTNKSSSRFYSRYYVADSSTSMNHTIWFRNVDVDNYYSLPFNRIISFGDSLTDNGNLHTATYGIVAAGGYYQGHFTNGMVWAEYLSKKLGLDHYNWAVGAAPTSLGNIFDMFRSMPYTLQTEWVNFRDTIDEVGITPQEISKTLFTLLVGGNNFANDVKGSPEEVASDIINFVDNLIHVGAKHILVVNLPDIGCAPKFENIDCADTTMRNNIIKLNSILSETVSIRQNQYPNIIFYKLDLFKITDDIILNPNKFYVTNTTNKCYSGSVFEKYKSGNICASPETYLFWDTLHPSTSLHCQVSDNVIDVIFDKHNKPHLQQNTQLKPVPSFYTPNDMETTSLTGDKKACASSFMH